MENKKELISAEYKKKANIIDGIYQTATPIVLSEENEKNLFEFIKMVKDALFDPEFKEKTIEKMLCEVILGAYQNRSEAYVTKGDGHEGGQERVQKLRQSADKHLLYALKMAKDITTPSINIAVKEAEQVNIANKQINVSNDLDKKDTNAVNG